eukprot:UN27638
MRTHAEELRAVKSKQNAISVQTRVFFFFEIDLRYLSHFTQYLVIFCIHQHSRNLSSEKGFLLHGFCVLEVDMSKQVLGRAESRNVITISHRCE